VRCAPILRPTDFPAGSYHFRTGDACQLDHPTPTAARRSRDEDAFPLCRSGIDIAQAHLDKQSLPGGLRGQRNRSGLRPGQSLRSVRQLFGDSDGVVAAHEVCASVDLVAKAERGGVWDGNDYTGEVAADDWFFVAVVELRVVLGPEKLAVAGSHGVHADQVLVGVRVQFGYGKLGQATLLGS